MASVAGLVEMTVALDAGKLREDLDRMVPVKRNLPSRRKRWSFAVVSVLARQ